MFLKKRNEDLNQRMSQISADISPLHPCNLPTTIVQNPQIYLIPLGFTDCFRDSC